MMNENEKNEVIEKTIGSIEETVEAIHAIFEPQPMSAEEQKEIDTELGYAEGDLEDNNEVLDVLDESLATLSESTDTMLDEAKQLSSYVESTLQDEVDAEWEAKITESLDRIQAMVDANDAAMDELDQALNDLEDAHNYTVAEYVETRVETMQEGLAI